MEESKKLKKTLYYFVVKIVFIGMLSFFVLNFMVGIRFISGVNMHPHIKDGDVVLYNRMEDEFYIGDVALYEYDGKLYCGRIVACSGDIVELSDDGELIVNSNVQNENIIYPTYKADEGIVYPYTVSDDSYFVLSDLRLQYEDSREFGCIHIDDMNGKVFQLLRIRGF